MVDKLLVRTYNVGLGDCIYVCIPDVDRGYHILVDCGSWSGIKLLENAMELLRNELPAAPPPDDDKKKLDLLIVTHRHYDHLAGFKENIFKDIKINHVWLSAAMNPNHNQAKAMNEFHAEVHAGLTQLNLLIDQGFPMSDALKQEIENGLVPNDEEMNLIENGLGTEPAYVHAGQTFSSGEIGLPADTEITILAPENNVDFYYLGDLDAATAAEAADKATHSAKDPLLPVLTPAGMMSMNRLGSELGGYSPGDGSESMPGNISAQDFQNLKSRLLNNVLAFTFIDNSIANNTSVVFLLNWKGKRLLFVGDAEWHSTFKAGRHNGSWNIMWHKYRDILDKPVDFLKIGHHGSKNATPWRPGKPSHEVSTILEAILPLPPENGELLGMALSSTERRRYKSIPDPKLVRELGRRVKDSVVYKTCLNETHLSQLKHREKESETLPHPQPRRTDFETLLNPDQPYAEILIEDN